jgi:glycosyltransferase involved in cell wall biosynthesis
MNEEENVKKLFDELNQVFLNIKNEKEIILIDDGSSDNTTKIIKDLIRNNADYKFINFRKNFGQTAAISAGIDNSTGDIIILMDGDLQNDPADIPVLLEKINEGYDVVSGWRKNRQDRFIDRKLPSWLANWLISKITKVHLHDYGCTLKAYRSEVIKNTRLYGEMHRFIPAYASWYGAKITEVVVNHRARLYGKTKYNIFRTFKVVLDLIVVKFLSKYSALNQ